MTDAMLGGTWDRLPCIARNPSPGAIANWNNTMDVRRTHAMEGMHVKDCVPGRSRLLSRDSVLPRLPCRIEVNRLGPGFNVAAAVASLPRTLIVQNWSLLSIYACTGRLNLAESCPPRGPEPGDRRT